MTIADGHTLAGSASPRGPGSDITTGSVAINSEFAVRAPLDFSSGASLGAVLLHEIGHVVGLRSRRAFHADHDAACESECARTSRYRRPRRTGDSQEPPVRRSDRNIDVNNVTAATSFHHSRGAIVNCTSGGGTGSGNGSPLVEATAWHPRSQALIDSCARSGRRGLGATSRRPNAVPPGGVAPRQVTFARSEQVPIGRSGTAADSPRFHERRGRRAGR